MKTLLPFILFLSVFLTLYGLLHYYFYSKLKGAIAMGPPYHGLILVSLLLMLLAPVLVNILLRHGSHLLATYLAHVGYTWMGALFLFFTIHLLIDIYSVIIHVSSKTSLQVFTKLMPGNTVSFVITVLLSFGIITYGRIEAGSIKIETVSLKTEKLPPEMNSLRIVQISDIHFSTVNGFGLARKIVDKIKSLNPDILVSTGDLIDRGLKDKERVAALFRGLKVPYGKYAVTGNHEFYSGIKSAVEFTEKASFRMLRNEGLAIGDLVNIAGVDDPTAKRFGTDANTAEDEILEKFSNKRLVVLLKHRPMISEKSVGMFDLQLSGHLHKGQIFPFSLLTSFIFPYHDGLYKFGGHSYLYVSRGTGTWGPSVRFLCPPEITVFEFEREQRNFK
jgi:predicted MPP superfamily phosphohydrolase